MRQSGLAFITCALCYCSAFAQSTSLQTLVNECASCHGANGMSSEPLWPNIAGQKYTYLVKQMRAFRDGTRRDPLMSAPSQKLSDEDIHALSEYYASLTPEAVTVVKKLNEAGKNVRAYCVSCHGMGGQTVNSEWPNLSGQHKDYLYRQLLLYRSGARQNPIMNVIAREFNEQQLRDVAEFYSQSTPRTE